MVLEGSDSRRRSAAKCVGSASLDAEHHLQFARLIQMRPASLAEENVGLFINQLRIKIWKWVSNIPDRNSPLKSAFKENYPSAMTYMVKSILAASLPLSVQDKVWRPCSSVTLTLVWLLPRECIVLKQTQTHKKRISLDQESKKTKIKQHHISQGKQQNHTSEGGQPRPHSWYTNHNTGTRQNTPTKHSTAQGTHSHLPFLPDSPRRIQPRVTNWAPNPDQGFNRCAKGHGADTCNSSPFCPYYGSRSHPQAACATFPDQVKRNHYLL